MKRRLLILFGLLVSTLVTSGCDDINSPPTITGLKDNYYVHENEKLELEISVSDADGDSVDITWHQLKGKSLWDEMPTGPKIQLNMPPEEEGRNVAIIQVTANDGTEESVVKFIITVFSGGNSVVNDVSGTDISDPGLDVGSDIMLIPNDINAYNIYEASSDKFEVEIVSESGVELNFSDEVEMTLFNAYEAKVITDMFDFNPRNNVLYVKEKRMDDFRSLLLQGEEKIELGNGKGRIELLMTGFDSSGHSISLETNFYHGIGTVSGTLVDANGNALPNLEGEVIELKGRTKYHTYHSLIRANGRFLFTDVPTDDYVLSLFADNGDVATEWLTIDSENRTVDINVNVMEYMGSKLN